MRKLNFRDFRVATRTTSREINRQIALNLIREHEPISRVDIAKQMGVQKSVVTLLINELINDGLVYEGGDGETTSRGRKPTHLHVNTRSRHIIAIDIRFTGTHIMLSDFSGQQIHLERFDTIFDPAGLVKELARRTKVILKKHKAAKSCVGIGVAIPGMVDHTTGRIMHAPMMGWRNVEIREQLARLTGYRVTLENVPKACALSQMWLSDGGSGDGGDFIYLLVSDGVGVGAVVGGTILRGHANTAGEFGHTPLNIEGPKCLCGLNGCWESYTSNLATVSRYLGRTLARENLLPAADNGEPIPTINDIIKLAKEGDMRAVIALQTTARYIGLGLATVIAGLNPARVYLGGEITAAWDLIEHIVRAAMRERALTEQAAATPIVITLAEYPRLRGAVALVVAPTFAAPRVA